MSKLWWLIVCSYEQFLQSYGLLGRWPTLAVEPSEKGLQAAKKAYEDRVRKNK